MRGKAIVTFFIRSLSQPKWGAISKSEVTGHNEQSLDLTLSFSQEEVPVRLTSYFD